MVEQKNYCELWSKKNFFTFSHQVNDDDDDCDDDDGKAQNQTLKPMTRTSLKSTYGTISRWDFFPTRIEKEKKTDFHYQYTDKKKNIFFYEFNALESFWFNPMMMLNEMNKKKKPTQAKISIMDPHTITETMWSSSPLLAAIRISLPFVHHSFTHSSSS